MNKPCKIRPVRSKLLLFFLCHSHQGLISVGGFCEAFTLLPFQSPAVAVTSKMQLLFFFYPYSLFVKQPFSLPWKFLYSPQYKIPNCLSWNTLGRAESQCFAFPTASRYFSALCQHYKIAEWQWLWNTSCLWAHLRNDALNIHLFPIAKCHFSMNTAWSSTENTFA